MKVHKRVIQREISPREILDESESSHKWFKITYLEVHKDKMDTRMTREYQKKCNVQRLLRSPYTFDPRIIVMEVVDNE